MRLISLLALPGLMLGTAVAAADFVPGRFYAPRFPMDGSPGSEGIWEFDPVTGTSRLFAETESFGRFVTGLTFTPDGSQLRASVRTTSRILGFDSDGQGTVVLDNSDGISLPDGSNNIMYDQFGNFFVANSFPSEILRFAPDGSPGTLFADVFGGGGSIAPAPDGSLYYASNSVGQLYHILTFGAQVLVDGSVGGTIATAKNGDVFLVNSVGIYRYPLGNGHARELLAPAPPNTIQFLASLTITADQKSLVALNHFGNFYSIDLATGMTTSLGSFPNDQFSGLGLAIAVPEPASWAFLLLGAILAARPRREQPGLTLAAAQPQNYRITAIRSTKGVRLCS